jgi:hypothetical protein
MMVYGWLRYFRFARGSKGMGHNFSHAFGHMLLALGGSIDVRPPDNVIENLI